MNSTESLNTVELQPRVSSFEPCLYFVVREEGGSAEAIATHMDDFLYRGEPDVLSETRVFSGYRFRAPEVQVTFFAHVGMELAQEGDFLVKLTQEEFATNLKPLPTSPEPPAARQQPLCPEDIESRQFMLSELRCPAAVSRPAVCARRARIASGVNSSQVSDVHRINGLVKTVKVWQQATVLKSASPSHPWASALRDADGRMRARGDRIHCGAASLAGRPDAAYGDQSAEGKCRSGYVIGLASSSLNGPCHILRRASRFTGN